MNQTLSLGSAAPLVFWGLFLIRTGVRGRVAEREHGPADCSTPVILLGTFFFKPSLGVIVFWGLKSKGCEPALLLLGSELLPNH